MKRVLGWGVALGCVTALAVALAARPAMTAEEAQPAASGASAQATPSPAGGEADRIAYTFTDDAQLKEFANSWDLRRLMLIRMSVLQEYWMDERDKLVALNKQIAERYKLDASKNYMFDAERRVLVEREAPPLTASQQPIDSSLPSTP